MQFPSWQAMRLALERDFAKAMAPELRVSGRSGPYFLLSSELDQRWQELRFRGICSPAFALLHRDVIGLRFTGNGPCAILSDGWFQECYGSPTDTACAEAAAVACHEMAHSTQRSNLCLNELPPGYGERINSAVDRDILECTLPAQPASQLDDGHDREFVRRTLHLAHRLRKLGWNTCFGTMLDWESAGLSHGSLYSAALRDEFERLEILPVQWLQHSSPPDEFVELWNATQEHAAAEDTAAYA